MIGVESLGARCIYTKSNNNSIIIKSNWLQEKD